MFKRQSENRIEMSVNVAIISVGVCLEETEAVFVRAVVWEFAVLC